MKNYIFIIALAAFASFTTPQLTHAQELPAITGTRLDISANAQQKAKPDIAVVTATVVNNAATAPLARAENAKKMQAVFAILKDKKIAESDMQTSGLTINPNYIYADKQAPKIANYQAVNTLTLTLHDLDKAPDVIDSLIQNGINQFSGPNFTIADPELALNKVRQQAMQKARARAEIYAQATGLKIKRIVSISESTNAGNPMPFRMMAKAASMTSEMAADAPTPIASGQVDLDANVNVTYELN